MGIFQTTSSVSVEVIPASPEQELILANLVELYAHDFSAFTVADSDVEDHVRTLIRVEILREPDQISIGVVGDGFLRYIVRTIAGTLIDVGRGKRTVERVNETLESRNRTNAGPSAPANGRDRYPRSCSSWTPRTGTHPRS